MTNNEALAYARVGALNIIESGDEVTPDRLFYEMYTLFDLYSEEAILREEERRF